MSRSFWLRQTESNQLPTRRSWVNKFLLTTGSFFQKPPATGSLPEQHMNYLCTQFGEHYHRERPRQGLANELPGTGRRKRKALNIVSLLEIDCHPPG